jgi:hypothetical protein
MLDEERQPQPMQYDVCLFRRNPECLDYLKVQVGAVSRAMAARTAWSLHQEERIHEISVESRDPVREAGPHGDEDFSSYEVPSIFLRNPGVESDFPFREL